MEEIWKVVSGWEGLYEISNLGRAKNSQGLILSPHISKQGYVIQTFCRAMEKKKLRTHILVAKAFILNPENKKTVNHKDGNKQNNNDWNLEWATQLENTQHAKDNKLYKYGSNHPIAKLNEDSVRQIKVLLHHGKPKRQIARQFDVHQKTIINISNNKIWREVCLNIY